MREDLQGTLDEIWNNHSPSSTLSESSRDSSGDASDVVITLRVGSMIRGYQDFFRMGDIGSSIGEYTTPWKKTNLPATYLPWRDTQLPVHPQYRIVQECRKNVTVP